jgi:hypothetical protein
MKQEPVAWMTEDSVEGQHGVTFDKSLAEQYGFDIPLYTAPRELSDEEIDEVASNFSELYESEARVYAAIEDAHGFARAILKKASEK